ncbi:EAL domain-containing protein [Lichenihabitans sp. Uapishka_5]|uniref:putative bifunctional diguanylate cyclase/phosphodiesterase n=1 Tax=Lichenihabitans sp. Uapishka_5 TaxID=3037302 RepID=UPI0029E7FEA3|nr:EAL domain-containing protein [Lichenihabitans sp. Uapishka_5]MDX7953776.1 EAL domain-containing protein [Lichenihabitans sp. Uapishka_5]
MHFRSIRIRLTASIAALLAIFTVVSATAVVSLIRIDRQIETVDRKWLAGTQLLGDLKNTISEFRVAEGYRFLAMDQPGVIQAEFLAERQATVVGELIGRFRPVAEEVDMVEDFRRFEATWRDLLDNHRAWIDEAAGDQMTKPMGYGSTLQRRYEAVQIAANNLIDDARAAASAEATAANGSATHATLLVAALSVMAGLLGAGLMVHAEVQIARPLGAITSSLAQLAEGDRSVRVPELHRRDEIGAMATAFEVFRRNAVALGQAQERAEALARHDALTGLANRRLFSTRLQSALKASRNGLMTAVMLIDLDHFKPVNDLHGHAVGDSVLCEVAARLRGLTGIGMLVARLGGDEFAVILPPAPDRLAALDQAIGLAARIVERLGEVIVVGDTEVVVGASLGIAMTLEQDTTAAEILRMADLAMYRAKHDGRGTFRFFEASMDADLRAKADLEADLRAALAAGEIEPFYQPIVDLASGGVAGFEVLARWHHRRRGFVPPVTFIPLLEQLGLLPRMTEAILRRALADAQAWDPAMTLAVNVSPRQLQDLAFPAIVANILMSAGFPPQRLEIEITETALMTDLSAAKTSLQALRALGVMVVLDDFGTGYSSLSHLREAKFDKIKIDRSFIGTLAKSRDSVAIVDAVLGLAHSLGMTVVAEGIETDVAAAMLTARGCGFGQGYLFSPAVPAAAVPALLASLGRLAA